MPILSSGSNVTLSVSAGQILTIQSDQAIFDFENPVGTRVGEYGADTVFGPFASGGSVKITSIQGPVYYELGAGAKSYTQFDPSNVNIGGGVIVGKNVLRLNNAARPLSVIPLGTSITAGGTVLTNGLSVFGSSYASVLCNSSGGRLRMSRNAGVSGNTVAQIAARKQSDVLAYAPDACLLEGGANDIFSGMSNADYAAMFNTIEQTVLALLKGGVLPIIVTTPPKNAAALESRVAQIFYYLLAEYYSLPLVDLYRVCVDPVTGNYKTGYSGDGLHPNNVAIAAIASAYGSALQNLETMTAPRYLAAYAETASNGLTNLILNGCFTGAGPIPSGFNANGTTNNIATAATFPYTGNTWIATGQAAGVLLQSSANITTGFAAGDVLRFTGHCEATGLAPSTGTGFNIYLTVGSGTQAPINQWPFNGSFDFSTDFTVPVGASTVYFNTYAADAGANYKVNNLTLVNLTAARAVWRPGTQT